MVQEGLNMSLFSRGLDVIRLWFRSGEVWDETSAILEDKSITWIPSRSDIGQFFQANLSNGWCYQIINRKLYGVEDVWEIVKFTLEDASQAVVYAHPSVKLMYEELANRYQLKSSHI